MLFQYNSEQLEMDIKRVMFASTIPNDPSRDLTATEVAQRVQELDNSLNNSFGRLLEFLYRLIRRMVEVAQRFGFISPELDVLAFNGYGFKIKVNTQLANQQTKKEVYDILQSLQVMAQYDPQMSYTSKVLKFNDMIPYILDKMGVPNQFIRSSDEISAMQEQEAQSLAIQQQNAIQMDIDSSNAKEQGKTDARIREYAETRV